MRTAMLITRRSLWKMIRTGRATGHNQVTLGERVLPYPIWLSVGIACLSVGESVLAEPVDDDKDVPLHRNTQVRFASVEEGRMRLGEQDRFVNALSRFDRQCRLGFGNDVSTEQFTDFVSNNVIAWEASERARIHESLRRISEHLRAYEIPFPDTILLVKTTGREEANAAYCRRHAVVIPLRFAKLPPARLDRLLLHELFHVLSSSSGPTRKELYAIIGFTVCEPIGVPLPLRDRKITNPDGPLLDAVITIEEKDRSLTLAPLLYASIDRFDPDQGGTVFKYLEFRLLEVQRHNGGWTAIKRDGKPLLHDPENLADFHRQIGANTKYILHPDEILADNFVHMVLQTEDLESPEVVAKMQRVLKYSE